MEAIQGSSFMEAIDGTIHSGIYRVMHGDSYWSNPENYESF